MNTAHRFRIAAVFVAALMLVYAPASLFSEFFSTKQPNLPADPSAIAPQVFGSELASTFLPFRTDLAGNHALALGLAAVQPGTGALSAADAQKNVAAQEAIKKVLRGAPYRSELWLVLTLLQTQRKWPGRPIIEALKMSYFTAPNDAQLMPLRLDTAARSEALADPDLKELARGDVRLMLLRQSDLRAAISSAYLAGSDVGRKFIEESVQSIDPELRSVLLK